MNILILGDVMGSSGREAVRKNLSKVIHARAVEIIEQVYLEIKNYGHEEQKKKLIAGIVLTGGGSQLKHLKQLVEYVTGMDTRVGYPNEHLAGDTDQNVTSPLYATAVGLLMDGLGRSEKNDVDQEASSTAENFQKDENQSVETENTEISNKTKIHKNRDSFLDKLTEKVKDFLDNAE